MGLAPMTPRQLALCSGAKKNISRTKRKGFYFTDWFFGGGKEKNKNQRWRGELGHSPRALSVRVCMMTQREMYARDVSCAYVSPSFPLSLPPRTEETTQEGILGTAASHSLG